MVICHWGVPKKKCSARIQMDKSMTEIVKKKVGLKYQPIY